MIDFRIKTFLTLCKELNYTNTAKVLHITQPAVSQHIKYLEEDFGVKLFHYDGKSLKLTREGKILYNFAIAAESSSYRTKKLMSLPINSMPPIKFGTTLTIGEYTMPKLLKRLILDYPTMEISMEVSNTEILLEKLKNGDIDFALLEGHFDKFKYDTFLFSQESFIGICSPNNPLSLGPVGFKEIFNERLILRERGSGSREIFEQILYEHNTTMDNFDKIIQIGNINIIKQIVGEDLGVSFLYKEAVENELRNKTVSKISIKDFDVIREFNFVFLKDSLHYEEYTRWFEYFKKNRN